MPYTIKPYLSGYRVEVHNKPLSKYPLTLEQAQKQKKAVIISELKRGGSNKKLNLLELFKGTGSVGKVFKDDFNIISLDNDKTAEPDILVNILNWDYKKFYEDTKFIPDFIWASPPCNTYSYCVVRLYERNTKTAEPLSDRAKEGTKILHKTLEIIDFFKSKNKNLKYVIENPVGMMRFEPEIKKLKYHMAYYSNYGFPRRKPTNFFSNFDLDLKPPIIDRSVETVHLKDIPLKERYRIPPLLIKDILISYFQSLTKK
jgi:hypothetical protein